MATASSLGLLVSVLLGGVAADRLPRRALLIVVEAVRVGTALAVGLLAINGLLQLWQLVVIAFLIGAAEAFFFPAYTALLPTLLPADELLAANGVEGMLRPVAQQALGPGAGRAAWSARSRPSVALLVAGGLYGSPCWRCWPCARSPVAGRDRGQLGAAASSARASATCSAPAGCSPRWPSPACTCWC